MNFDWHAHGFKHRPHSTLSLGCERLFRAWGGSPRRKWGNNSLPGVCFSLDRAKSRSEAEDLYAVMEWQNPVRYLTEFSIPCDPRAILGGSYGSQVFVERAFLYLVRELNTSVLDDDLSGKEVYSGKLPSKDS